MFRYVKIHPDAQPPKKEHKTDAGFDLASIEDVVIPARGRGTVRTGLFIDKQSSQLIVAEIAVPEDTYGRIAPRSGLAKNHGIDVGGGVVDHQFTGEVIIILFNHNDEPFHVTKGQRVAQLVLERIAIVDAVEVESLEQTERGSNGFGSTG